MKTIMIYYVFFVALFVPNSSLAETTYSKLVVQEIVSEYFRINGVGEAVLLPRYDVVSHIPQKTLRHNEDMMRNLEKKFTVRKAIVGETKHGDIRLDDTTSSVIPTFVEDLIVLSRDVGVKYRGGYMITENGVLYLRRGIMFSPHKYKGKYAYGIATVKRSTGPAFRINW
jgi:hypothetical protein